LYAVNAFDLESFINRVYGFSGKPGYPNGYCYQADQEMSNDTWRKFWAQKVDGRDKWDEDKFQEFLKDGYGGGFILTTVLDDMATRGLIPEGTYLVELSY
jgi:hypothetical protein